MSKVFRVSAVKVLLVVLNRLPFKTPCRRARLVLLERLLYDEDRSVKMLDWKCHQPSVMGQPPWALLSPLAVHGGLGHG